MNIFAVRETQQENQIIQKDEPVKVIQFRQKDEPEKLKVNNQVPEEVLPAVIKVVSAGGGGGNALNRMIKAELFGVNFIAINTDIQDLYKKSLAEVKLQIGARVTHGHGAGSHPEKGEKAALEDHDAIAEVLKGADMVFITAGMGGGTGTGSVPVIAKIAKEMGILTIAVVTLPFEFEGRYRMKRAEEGINKLREAVDTLIVIPNQNLFKVIDNTITYDNAFQRADEVLCQGVRGISQIIVKNGFKNVDFADVETIMRDRGDAIMGIGSGSGENRAMDAVTKAIDNPLLEDTSIEGATAVLINIAGPEDITLFEIQNIIKTVKDKCDPEVNLIHGILKEPSLDNYIQVTVIATGFAQKQFGDNTSANTKQRDSDFIKFSEFAQFRDRTKQTNYVDFLPPKEFQDDLDVPSVIRKHDYQADEKQELAKAGNK